jgi:exosome complex component RRP4
MRRWAVDIRSMTQASLQLTAVDLPGGIQRRRTTDDELIMRDMYCEGDVVAAEVCALVARVGPERVALKWMFR